MSLSSFKYRKVFAVYAYSWYGTSQPTASKEQRGVSALCEVTKGPFPELFAKWNE